MKSDPRPVVRCARCNLVQFVTRSGVCRRCLAVLPEGEKPAPREKITQCAKRVTGGDGGAGKRAQAVRFIREQFELTQGEMAVYCGLRGHSAIAHLEHAPEGREVSLRRLERLGLPVEMLVAGRECAAIYWAAAKLMPERAGEILGGGAGTFEGGVSHVSDSVLLERMGNRKRGVF